VFRAREQPLEVYQHVASDNRHLLMVRPGLQSC